MDYTKEIFNFLYLEKIASVVVIFTRITDTILAIQSKITESNKELVKVSVEYAFQEYIRFKNSALDDDLGTAVNLSKEFFYENGKIWNRLPIEKLNVFIKEEMRIRRDILAYEYVNQINEDY